MLNNCPFFQLAKRLTPSRLLATSGIGACGRALLTRIRLAAAGGVCPRSPRCWHQGIDLGIGQREPFSQGICHTIKDAAYLAQMIFPDAITL